MNGHKHSHLRTIVCLAAAWLFLGILAPLGIAAQTYPSASPTMVYTDADGVETEDLNYDGNAPFVARFEARPTDDSGYDARYEWRFSRAGETEPFLVRYDQDTEYTFNESGSFVITLFITFTGEAGTFEFEMDSPISVNISESFLEFPNAFTPNGDGINDTFHAKEGYRSIVDFNASVFNRWGKKLYEWHDPADGWDGTMNGDGGTNAPDGAYYFVCSARGADGRKYTFKKVINLLRGYTEGEVTGGE